MLTILRFVAAGIVAGGAFVVAVILWPIGRGGEAIDLVGDVDRGAYLARASGCIACHTDGAAGGAPLAGGAGLPTDFGTFFPPNLTTDPVQGIGGWSVEDFARAVRQGVSPEGNPYFPTFTYPFYTNFTDQEIADLWAAFRTVPAVAMAVPDHSVSFPFDQRWGLKLWRAAFLRPPETTVISGRSDTWNRGRWLAEGASHCAACHTARNLAGARIPGAAFAGNDALPGGGRAPSIRADDLRARGWTVDNLAFALRVGAMPDGDAFGGSMGEVVRDGTAFMTADDLRAISIYILDED